MTFRPARAAGTPRLRFAAPFAALLAVGALSACAAPAPAASSPEAGVRVLVELVRPSEDFQAIAAEASRRAGVPARHAAAVSARWHALELRCSDAVACQAAMQRLRDADTVYRSVEPDGRKHRTAG